jgi:hypothetical protein
VLCCSSCRSSPYLLWFENFGSRPSIVSKISLAALFQGRQPVQLPLRTVAGTGLLAPTVVQSIGLSSLIVDRSVREASGNVIPTRKYREVLVTFSLAGSGDRGAAALRGAFNDPSTCCTALASEVSLPIARPSKHGSHHVCDNRSPAHVLLKENGSV